MPDITSWEEGKPSSVHAWPQRLADRLGVACTNLGRPGSSNDYIVRQIISSDWDKGCLIVPLWTHPTRVEFTRGDDPPFSVGPWTTDIDDDPVTRDAARYFYGVMFRPEDGERRSLINLVAAHAFAQAKGLRILHAFVEDRYIPAWLDATSYDAPLMSHDCDRGHDGCHFGPKTHERFAVGLLNRITALGWR